MQTSNKTILSVAELNAEVNQLLNQGFPLLWVEGEISNLSRPASGHLYFSLKDNKSQIRCAMFRNRNMKLSIQPQNGMKVVVRGRVGLYEPRGDYQLIAEHMEDAGVGQLQKQFEALKKKLSDAGLFNPEHKKECPEYPKRIAIITSPTGAAIQDILNVLKRRSPHTPILIYPVAVQGASSKNQIEAAIRRANLDNKCDVIIIARGGGSIEDLWSFNEENVAKAIYQSSTPIICGVGHEIDFTIADFVADLRAPTPSAAAELVTADRNQLLTDVVQTELWLTQTIQQNIKHKQQKLDWLVSRLTLQQPSNKIQQQSQKLDEMEIRLQRIMNQTIKNKQLGVQHLLSRLSSNTPSNKISISKQHVMQNELRLKQAMQSLLHKRRATFELQMATLDSASPLKTLERGYAIIKDAKTNQVLNKKNELTSKRNISIQLKDGETKATIR